MVASAPLSLVSGESARLNAAVLLTYRLGRNLPEIALRVNRDSSSALPAHSSQGRAGLRDALWRYLMSIGTVVTAGAGQWLLVQSFGPMPPFITFYPAVLLVAVVAGGGPGCRSRPRG